MDRDQLTILSAYHRALWDGKKHDYLVITDTGNRARELWKTLLICVRPFLIRAHYSSRTVTLEGGSTIQIVHCDERGEKLRGRRFDRILLDEVRRCAK